MLTFLPESSTALKAGCHIFLHYFTSSTKSQYTFQMTRSCLVERYRGSCQSRAMASLFDPAIGHTVAFGLFFPSLTGILPFLCVFRVRFISFSPSLLQLYVECVKHSESDVCLFSDILCFARISPLRLARSYISNSSMEKKNPVPDHTDTLFCC